MVLAVSHFPKLGVFVTGDEAGDIKVLSLLMDHLNSEYSISLEKIRFLEHLLSQP